jgi:F420 biosynthesis protein FbiB-like protein
VSNLSHILSTRRSIRRYRAETIPKQLVEQLLTAAQWAPSAHNRQPWRFVVLSNKVERAQLAQAMAQQLHMERLADGTAPAVVQADAERSQTRIIEAPLAILVCVSMAEMDTYPDAARNEHEFLMAVQSTAMAVQNLLLQAHALGLGACWMCAPLFCPQTVQAVLALPNDWQAQALITIGFPANAGKPAQRKPLHEVTQWR